MSSFAIPGEYIRYQVMIMEIIFNGIFTIGLIYKGNVLPVDLKINLYQLNKVDQKEELLNLINCKNQNSFENKSFENSSLVVVFINNTHNIQTNMISSLSGTQTKQFQLSLP